MAFLYSVKVHGVNVRKSFIYPRPTEFKETNIYNICKQIRQGSTEPKCDQRGKHHNRVNRTPDQMVKSIHDHIKAILKFTSYYSIKCNLNRLYIDHDLSIASLYKKYYRSWCIEQGISPAKEDAYRHIFCHHYNIGFKLPKRDTCETCDHYIVFIESNKGDETDTKNYKLN